MRNYIPINLNDGIPKRVGKNPMDCFFIVDHISDEDFMRKVALEFMEANQEYHFYGKEEPRWHMEFDLVSIDTFEDLDDFTLTSGYDDLEDFAWTMKMALIHSAPNDVYLFYDDENIRRKIDEIIPLIED